MPSEMIPFGKPMQALDSVDFQDGVAQNLINGWVNELGHYVKMPGLTLFQTQGSSRIDALFETTDGIVFFVTAGTIYKLASNGTVTACTGTGTTSGNPCTFAEDGTGGANLFIAHGGTLTKLNTSSLVGAAVSAGNAPTGVTHVCFIDGYLITNGTGGNPGDTFFSNDKTNGYVGAASWEVFNNEAKPDSCNGVFARWKEIFATGGKSVEVSFDDGTTPWAVIDGAYLEYGVLSAYSVVFIEKQFYFVSNVDGAIRIVNVQGREPIDISEAYRSTLQTLTDVANAKGFGVQIQGRPFYFITFPADSLTLAYNIKGKVWSQVGFWNGSSVEHHLMNCYLYSEAHKCTYIGDRRANGKIYKYTGLDDDGTLIRFELTSGRVNRGTHNRKRSNSIMCKVKRGAVIDGSNPTFSVQFSDDSRSFGTTRSMTLGQAGDLFNIAYINRCGKYRNRQYKVVHTDKKSDFVFAEAQEDYEVLKI